jgi:xanthine dehydrogenase molybdopterin-binding subunit B
MLHGRVVRPRGQAAYGAGAKVLSVDDSYLWGIAGARVVRRGDFVGVVAINEWDAIRAAQQLKVTWDTKPTLPGTEGLHQQMRTAKSDDSVVRERGDVNGAFASAPHVVSQNCRGPYQGHASFGPNCAIADVTADAALVMCSTQDIYTLRNTLARIVGLAGREGSRSVLRRFGYLRPQLPRRCRASGGDTFKGDRQTGSPSIHAMG